MQNKAVFDERGENEGRADEEAPTMYSILGVDEDDSIADNDIEQVRVNDTDADMDNDIELELDEKNSNETLEVCVVDEVLEIDNVYKQRTIKVKMQHFKRYRTNA